MWEQTIGDNIRADIRGAEGAGMEAILVRTEHAEAKEFYADLHELCRCERLREK